MQLINDGIGVLLGLAPVAALVALVLAGLALRNQSSLLQNSVIPKSLSTYKKKVAVPPGPCKAMFPP